MLRTLKQHFGFEALRPGQAEVMDNILSGRSAAAIFPTGSGKSLCYQLPALQLPHLTLVISPLLALMKDQLEFLHSKGIAAAAIDSTQSRESTQNVMQQARSGALKILMISVERLKNERFRQFIARIPISLLVVDEAHCISEWGHNFRPDYLKLPAYQQQLKIPQALLLTATATPQVIEDMRHKFAIAEDAVTVTGFYRSNLTLNVLSCSEEQKFTRLQSLMQESPAAPTVVYVTLQKTAELVADRLQQSGINAIPYHAGMKTELRDAIQQQFMQGASPCIVATIAFGMGIDKADIRRVIHYDLPKSVENYSQEIGRAGRDGLQSACTVLANADNLNVLENFIYGDTPDKSSIAYVVEQIYACDGDWEVMLNRLSFDSNIRLLPLKTLLVYLELHNIIESQYSYFDSYRFKFIDSAEKIISRFQDERRAFVEAIFHCSAKARTWYSVDFGALWDSYGGERKRAVAAIDYFQEKGWIELESKQLTDVYRVVNTQISQQELVERLYNLFARKEESEIRRIHAMLDFFQSEQCLSHTLAGYFADQQAPERCGHCSVCAGRPARLKRQELPPVDPRQVANWLQPYRQAGEGLLADEALSRFLCGITTPLCSRLKGSKMEGYGKLEKYPFAEVNRIVRNI